MILDKKTLLPTRTLSRKELSKDKMGSDFFKTERGWACVGSSCKRMKKGEDCYLTFNELGESGFAAPRNMVAYPPREEASYEVLLPYFAVRTSPNGKYVLQYSRDTFRVSDASFNEVYKKREPDFFKINGKDADRKNFKWYVDDDGNILASCVLVNGSKSESDLTRYKVFFLKYDRQKDEFLHQEAELKDEVSSKVEGKNKAAIARREYSLEGRGDLRTIYDIKTQKLITAGVYEDEAGGHVFSVQYDCRNNQIVPLQKHLFPSDLIEKISISSFNGKKVRGSVIFQDLLLKSNGDIMMLLELDNSNVSSGYKPLFGDDGIEIKVQNPTFDIGVMDVMYFNLGPDNNLKFYGNLPKKQVNSELEKELLLDELSFAATAIGNDVHVVYNTLSKAEGRELMDVKIDENGQISRKNLLTLNKGSAVMPTRLNFGGLYDYEFITDSSIGVRTPIRVSDNAIMLRARNGKKNTLLMIDYGN